MTFNYSNLLKHGIQKENRFIKWPDLQSLKASNAVPHFRSLSHLTRLGQKPDISHEIPNHPLSTHPTQAHRQRCKLGATNTNLQRTPGGTKRFWCLVLAFGMVSCFEVANRAEREAKPTSKQRLRQIPYKATLNKCNARKVVITENWWKLCP